METIDVTLVYRDLDRERERLERLASLLSDDERVRARRLVIPLRRERFVLGRAILRETLAAIAGKAPEALRFSVNADGKPSLADAATGDDRITFSQSRSEEGLLVAVAKGTEIGCDIEKLRTIAQAPAMAAQWFTPREREAIGLFPAGPNFDGAFLSCWTRKEAVLKALGTGLQRSLAFDSGFGAAGTGSVSVDGDTLFVTNIGLHSGWIAAVAAPLPARVTVEIR